MRSWTKWGAAVAAAAALAATCGAAQAQEAVGEWHGTMSIPNGGPTLRAGVTIKAKAGGGYEGSITSPDQGPGEVAMDAVKADGGTLNFSVAAIMGSYSGRWDPAKKAWVGEWMQGGGSLPLELTSGKP